MEKQYMEWAIELARKGLGRTNPNPMVGAVIVKDGRILAEGYHEAYGKLHAERNAIGALKESAEGADLYVTLEPCCHYGKTPPCTEAIIEAKIKRVIIGSRDPNPKVAGKGAALLRKAGIEVTEDFMREECDRINPVFFHYIQKKTPYVVLKYAMTADGKTATKTGASRWITGEEARTQVHTFRHRYMAIMTGIGTVLEDDPMLNTRIAGLKSPIRVICDSHLSISPACRICKTAKEYPTILACAEADEAKAEVLRSLGLEILILPDASGRVDLRALMRNLGERGIDSVLLEGGGTLNEAALRLGLVNRVLCYIAPKIFGGGEAKSPVGGIGVKTPQEAYLLRCEQVSTVGNDLLIEYECLERS